MCSTRFAAAGGCSKLWVAVVISKLIWSLENEERFQLSQKSTILPGCDGWWMVALMEQVPVTCLFCSQWASHVCISIWSRSWTVGFHNIAFSHAAFWLFVAAQAFTATLLLEPSMKRPAQDLPASKAAAAAVPRYLRVDEVDCTITKETLVCWGISMLVAVESLSIWWLLYLRQVVNNKSPERIVRSPDRIGMAGRLPRLRFIYARALDSVISRWLQVWKIQDVVAVSWWIWW